LPADCNVESDHSFSECASPGENQERWVVLRLQMTLEDLEKSRYLKGLNLG